MTWRVSLLVTSLVMWLLLLVAMIGNGTFRVTVLQPALGEDLGRQVASLSGILIILGMTRLFVATSPRGSRHAKEIAVKTGRLCEAGPSR